MKENNGGQVRKPEKNERKREEMETKSSCFKINKIFSSLLLLNLYLKCDSQVTLECR